MPSPIDAQLILADAAQADNGKVHMLGAGWSITGTPTAPQSVVALIKVPWDRANEQLPLRLNLLNEDGRDVLMPAPEGEPGERFDFQAVLEVGRPSGVKPGNPIDSAMVVNVPSLTLVSGGYTWLLSISEETFRTSFQVR